MLADRVWTPEELDLLPETGERFELLDGVLLVTPQPTRRHQRVALLLSLVLEPYVATHQLGETYTPGEYRWGQNLLAPDVVVAPVGVGEEYSWRSMQLPLLVVEIHSPSSRLRDQGMKRRAYMALGIPEYWQVDLDEQSVLVARQGRDDVLVTSVLEWRPDPGVPALRVEVATLFR